MLSPSKLWTEHRSELKATGHEVIISIERSPGLVQDTQVAKDPSFERTYTADQLSTNSARFDLSMPRLVHPMWLWGVARTPAESKAALAGVMPVASFVRFKGLITMFKAEAIRAVAADLALTELVWGRLEA